MPRLLFEKTENAIWVSHLDLMRLFQRAFKRAGLSLAHSQGFHPRPSVSIILPLSVGIESQCELLEFSLVNSDISLSEIKDRLNQTLVAGIRVLDVYDNGKKPGLLSLLECQITLEYDAGVPQNACAAITALFETSSVVVPKKTKSGIQDQNIIPMIRKMQILQSGDREVVVRALICCQNPTLNPTQIASAIEKYLPEYKPDFCTYRRLEVYDSIETIFR